MPTSRFDRTQSKTARARDLRTDVSSTESRLWPRLRASRLGAPFRRQHPIGPYFADYCCVPLKLVVEVDGPLHDPQTDAGRDAYLNELGWDVVRISMEEMDERFESVVERIRREVQVRLLVKRAK